MGQNINSCCGSFPPNSKSSLGYILKTSGHTCEHIVKLSAPGNFSLCGIRMNHIFLAKLVEVQKCTTGFH